MMHDKYWLSKGAHDTADAGRCAMEWVSYLAGEPHSDHPVCVSPMLKSFCILLNDALPDDQRQRLRPYLARTIGTAGDGLDEQRRWMCVDWLIREYTPAWLELVPSLVVDAERLRLLLPVLTAENVQRVMGDLGEVRKRAGAARDAARAAAWDAAGAAAGAAARAAAWDAARDAARAAAWDAAWAAAGAAARAAAWDAAGAAAGAAARAAAWDAARDAARAAAWDAAWAAAGAAARAAAWDAAWDAAGAAARAAAWAAARDAAWDALAPTVRVLWDSVLSSGGLLDRMLPAEAIQLPVAADANQVCAVR